MIFDTKLFGCMESIKTSIKREKIGIEGGGQSIFEIVRFNIPFIHFPNPLNPF